jgi:hypothetical protein
MEYSLLGVNVGSGSCKMPERAIQLLFMDERRPNEILGFGLKGFLSWLTTATTRTQSTLLA